MHKSRQIILVGLIAAVIPGVSFAVTDVTYPLSSAASGNNWGWNPASAASYSPYSAVGVVDTSEARGSGCAVLPHIVLTCGHVLLDDYGNWRGGIRWSRARTPSNTSSVNATTSSVSSSYRSRLQQGYGKENSVSLSVDWGYMAFNGSGAGPTHAGMMPGYLSALDPGGYSGLYEIVGYPSGKYTSSSDSRRNEMHSTNPGMNYSRFYRSSNFYLDGVLTQSGWFQNYNLYSYSGNSGGPLFAYANGAKYLVGIYVSNSKNTVISGVRELSSSVYNNLVSKNESYKGWISTRVGGRRTGSPVKVHQAWRQVLSVDGSGRLQATFFNGSTWQTATLGGQVLNYGTSLFDIHPQRGWVFYVGGGDIWMAYSTASGWQHAKVFDYPTYRSGDPYPVGVSVDPTYGVVGIQESNNNKRMLYLSSWTTGTSTLPAGRLVSNTKWGPMAWDYRTGSTGIVGRFYSGGWRSVDLTGQMAGVLPGDASLTTTYDGKLAPLMGGLVFASQASTLEMLYPSGSLWTRWFIQSGVDSRSWIAADSARNVVYFRNSSGNISFVTLGSYWQRTDTTISSDYNNAAAVLEAYGLLFHGQGSDLNVVARY